MSENIGECPQCGEDMVWKESDTLGKVKYCPACKQIVLTPEVLRRNQDKIRFREMK